MYQELRFKIAGVSPLIQHNGQLANPLNDYARALKKITSKRNKTDEDYMEMARIEWYGGLYLVDSKPVIPGWVFEAAFSEAARKFRKGKLAAIGILCPDDAILEYEGPEDLEVLRNTPEFVLTCMVKIKTSKVLRTRPRFDEWGAPIRLLFDPDQFNEEDIWNILDTMGEKIGLCDWRPKFGRFEVKRI